MDAELRHQRRRSRSPNVRCPSELRDETRYRDKNSKDRYRVERHKKHDSENTQREKNDSERTKRSERTNRDNNESERRIRELDIFVERLARSESYNSDRNVRPIRVAVKSD